MPNYRRAFVPGGCWFFTVNLLDRRTRLLTEHIDHLRAAARLARARHPFHINAVVILPDPIHAGFTSAEARCAGRAANAAYGNGGFGNT
jgi:putative transposase